MSLSVQARGLDPSRAHSGDFRPPFKPFRGTMPRNGHRLQPSGDRREDFPPYGACRVSAGRFSAFRWLCAVKKAASLEIRAVDLADTLLQALRQRCRPARSVVDPNGHRYSPPASCARRVSSYGPPRPDDTAHRIFVVCLP